MAVDCFSRVADVDQFHGAGEWIHSTAGEWSIPFNMGKVWIIHSVSITNYFLIVTFRDLPIRLDSFTVKSRSMSTATRMESEMTQVNIGKGIELDVDFNRLPANAIAYLLNIGARNVLMDSHASMTAKDNPDDYVEKSREIAMGKLDALYKGEIRVGGGGGRTSDPVVKEARAIAAGLLKGKMKPDDDGYKAKLAELAGNEKVVALAKKRVAESKELDLDVEI